MAKKKDADKVNDVQEAELGNPDVDQDAINKEKDVGDSGDRGSSRKDSPDDYGPLHGSGGPGVAEKPEDKKK